jgi:hypothetical protein
MKEWVTIRPSHSRSWAKLAEEAQQFVAAAARPSRRR